MGKRGKNFGLFDNRKGQVTLFIIVAVVIVAIAVLVYVFFPQVFSSALGGEQDPKAFIQICIKDEIKSNVELVSAQGGSLEPEFYFTYNDVKIEYLCYTNENYNLCVVQQPLLKNHVESEIANGIKEEVKNCFSELKTSLERSGQTVAIKEGEISVELLPERVISNFNYIVTIGGTDTKRYENFSVILNNNLYELVGISKSLVEREVTYGDVDPRIYMAYYPDLRVEKNLRDDGTKIYTLTDRKTGNRFQFASRSLVFPPGH